MTGPLAPGDYSILPGEEPHQALSSGSLFVDILPSEDLGNSSFVVGDKKRHVAAVIDATRDATRYLSYLDSSGLSLKWTLDTHLHADFVSGGSELSQLTRAKFGSSADAEVSVDHEPLNDKDEIDLGSGKILVLKSPGHTPEHVSYLLQDEKDRPMVLFSGGSLMAGTAARPDLLGPKYTYRLVKEEYITLNKRYAAISSEVAVLPTHIGGSFCGVGSRPIDMTTFGIERQTNRLFLATDPAMFLAAYLSASPFPKYYGIMRPINQGGGLPLGGRVPELTQLSPGEAETLRKRPRTTVIDTREQEEFEREHIPSSLSIPLDGPFSAWTGWLLPAEENILLVAGSRKCSAAAQISLLRIGYDRIKGVLAGGIAAYAGAGYPLSTIPRTTMRGLRRMVENGEALTLLDARNQCEAAENRIPGSVNIPLPDLQGEATARLDPTLPLYVHCQTGFRAGIAASILVRLGFQDVHHVTDGPEGWDR